MKLFKKILIVMLILGVISIIFLAWYWVQHQMDEAHSFEINGREMTQHVLIATQGSKFKDAVVEETINQLKSLPVYIKVIDVSQLATVNEKEWAVIILIHTWEYSKPELNTQAFIDRAQSKWKFIVLSTSGSGEEMIKDVDGISSASIVDDAKIKSDEIVRRVRLLLTI